jgi:A/G-specific adenine glycosylase
MHLVGKARQGRLQNGIPDAKRTAIAEPLLEWFVRNQRPLPWRISYSPYEIWISEVMLQQTRVETVIPHYLQWLKRFPTLQAIAAAPEDEILKHWEGMGYYARAQNIQKTARILVAECAAQFPGDHQAILRLPGIGPYTAGAIMSLAFKQDVPAVDGNVERVLARLFDIKTPVKERETRAFIRALAQGLIPKGEARNFNQALMELGAVVCVPRNPSCGACPIDRYCASLRLGIVQERPVPARKKKTVAVEAALGVLVRERRIFIQKRGASGLMPGLWEFPGGKIKAGESPEQALVREFSEELGIKIHPLHKLSVIKHKYTSFKVTLHCFLCRASDERQEPVIRAAVASRWVTTEEIAQFAFPAANGQLIKRLQANGELRTLASLECDQKCAQVLHSSRHARVGGHPE